MQFRTQCFLASIPLCAAAAFALVSLCRAAPGDEQASQVRKLDADASRAVSHQAWRTRLLGALARAGQTVDMEWHHSSLVVGPLDLERYSAVSGLDLANPDGFDDLDVGFSAGEVGSLICPLGKKELSAPLIVTGTLIDGTPLEALNDQMLGK